MSPWGKACARSSGLALLAALFLAASPVRALEQPPRETPILSFPQTIHEAAAPPMYLRTTGPPGQPAAKSCEGCSQFLERAAQKAAAEPLAVHSPGSESGSGWHILHTEGFEEDWPGTGSCQILSDASTDGLVRTWGRSEQRSHSGDSALWPASGGADGLKHQPAVSYPGNLSSWLVCGPFDLSAASSASAAFWLWSEVEEGHDEFFFGVSNGSDDWFYGYAWDAPVGDWTEYTVYFPVFTGSPAHDSVWLAWNFESDASNPVAYQGTWLDDIQISSSMPCPVVDPGDKGVNVHPSELPGQVETIADSGAGWVRLELMRQPDGSLDLDKYGSLVEGLCEQGIATIGLVDYTTIPEDLDGDGKTDYDDPEDYLTYQQRFTETVESLGHHLRGKVRHWEIWNEENGLQWHIRPEYYARLLVKTSEILKTIDPDNKVLFGGLDHVWVTSQYLEPVYDALDEVWDGARPFDILAVHPYFTRKGDIYILDPKEYLWANADPPHTTLDAYLDYMDAREDGDKDIWITELGWNSALDNPAINNCPGIKPWCVDRATQAQYLGDSFDILFNEVADLSGDHDRIGTIVWYQYHDTAWSAARMARWMSVDAATIAADPDAICPADWGLVDGNRAPKLAYWAYQAYPQRATGWQLVSFTATPQPGAIRLEWETALEDDLLGFTLHRAESPDGPRIQISETVIPAQHPGEPQGGVYDYWDMSGSGSTTYFYFLRGLCGSEPATIYGPVRATTETSPLQADNNSPTPLGSPTTLTATLSLTAAAEFTYTWALGDSGSAYGAVVTHTYPHAGVYTAVVTASSSLSELQATTMVSVEDVVSGLTVSHDGPSLLGDPTTLTATIAAGSHLNYLWAFGDGGLGLGPVVTHRYPEAQAYTAVVTASNRVSALTATAQVEIQPRLRHHVYLPVVVRQSP